MTYEIQPLERALTHERVGGLADNKSETTLSNYNLLLLTGNLQEDTKQPIKLMYRWWFVLFCLVLVGLGITIPVLLINLSKPEGEVSVLGRRDVSRLSQINGDSRLNNTKF